MWPMRVAVLDVGSNTVRLLVADRNERGLVAVHEAKEHLGLGEEVERDGVISTERLARAAVCVRRFARDAREFNAVALEVIVTAPGRQSANAADLVAVLAAAAGAPVRVVSPEEEGRLAYEGALAALENPPRTVAVCDIGGGSSEIAVGTPDAGPAWLVSLDVGSLRLAHRFLTEDPPGRKALAALRADVAASLEGLTPPMPMAALAAGGAARALGKVVGPELGEEELAEAERRLAKRPAAEIVKRYRIHPARARTLPAGAVILSEVQRLLGVPLGVSRTGLREGAALALLAEAAAA
jgi:exopolyphosphatase / guanosine-5'-triphosphate,3'-diphosphate pyrophosphatase